MISVQVTDLNSSVTIVPSVVQTVAGVGEVEFIYLSDSFNGNATVQMTPSFASITASDMVIINLVHNQQGKKKFCVYPEQYFWGLQEAKCTSCDWHHSQHCDIGLAWQCIHIHALNTCSIV